MSQTSAGKLQTHRADNKLNLYISMSHIGDFNLVSYDIKGKQLGHTFLTTLNLSDFFLDSQNFQSQNALYSFIWRNCLVQ